MRALEGEGRLGELSEESRCLSGSKDCRRPTLVNSMRS